MVYLLGLPNQSFCTQVVTEISYNVFLFIIAILSIYAGKIFGQYILKEF